MEWHKICFVKRQINDHYGCIKKDNNSNTGKKIDVGKLVEVIQVIRMGWLVLERGIMNCQV